MEHVFLVLLQGAGKMAIQWYLIGKVLDAIHSDRDPLRDLPRTPFYFTVRALAYIIIIGLIWFSLFFPST